MNTIRLLKLIDGIIGKAAVMLLPAPARSTAKGVISSLLIIRPGGIGDAVLLAPMIRLFKERYPATEITVLAEQRNAGVFFFISGDDTGILLRSAR
jgi:hypothetical protein